MKIKIVPASELSPKTLRAEDYVMKPFKVTYREEIEYEVIVKLDADDPDDARLKLDEMQGENDSDFINTLHAGKRVGLAITERELIDVEAG